MVRSGFRQRKVTWIVQATSTSNFKLQTSNIKPQTNCQWVRGSERRAQGAESAETNKQLRTKTNPS